jgi:drug/metabolite transporter (DMT)-like permease
VLTWSDGGALLAVLLWGANFPVLKHVMAVIDPLPAMFLRSLLSSLVLVGFLRALGRWRLPDRREWPTLLPVSLVGATLNQVLFSFGLHLTTASHSGLIFTLTPLLVYGLGHALGQLRIGRREVVGLGLGVAGTVLILGAPWAGAAAATGATGGVTLLGDLLTVGSAITWAVWTMMAAPLLRRHGTLLATVWITMTGTLGLLIPALPGLLALRWAVVSWDTVAGLAYASTVAGAGGSLLWYAAVRRLGPARTAVYANMESVFAVLAAVVVLGERVEGTALVGGGAVVAGVLLTRREKGASRPGPPSR